MKCKIIPRIVNIVASTSTNQKLNLDKIRNGCPCAEFNPAKYFALIFRVSYPKVSILVNKSGKLIFTGAKSIADIYLARNDFFLELKKMGYLPEDTDITIQNIVIRIDIMDNLPLERIYERRKNLNLEYEPEIFPGLIFKNKNPQFTSLIFRSGKIIIIGIKNLTILDSCIKSIQNLLSND